MTPAGVSLWERLGLEYPIVGARLGGGFSRARLTVAIAEAGGLGQLGLMLPRCCARGSGAPGPAA